jgi:hypothetical protein
MYVVLDVSQTQQTYVRISDPDGKQFLQMDAHMLPVLRIEPELICGHTVQYQHNRALTDSPERTH